MLTVLQLRSMTEDDLVARFRSWGYRHLYLAHQLWQIRDALPEDMAVIEPCDIPILAIGYVGPYGKRMDRYSQNLVDRAALNLKCPLLAPVSSFRNAYRTPHEDD